MKKKTITLFTVLSIVSFSMLHAQTINTFETLSLPETNSDYATDIIEDGGAYSFATPTLNFEGYKESWGGYFGFNYSNHTDSTTGSFTNDRASITGGGYNGSENYGVAYLSSDWPEYPEKSLPLGVALTGDAEGGQVAGFYYTNTTYAYYYMDDNYSSGDFLTLTIKGYLDNEEVPTTIELDLARFGAEANYLLKEWEWVSLLSLGNIDSFTIQLESSDDFTPFYIAIDDITTMDGTCNQINEAFVIATEMNQIEVGVNATYPDEDIEFEYAIDLSATLSPTGTIYNTNQSTFTFADLIADTEYIIHFRLNCDGNEWDTLMVKTEKDVAIVGVEPQEFKIFPNPSSDYIYITGVNAKEILIFDVAGKQISNALYNDKINIQNFLPGMYILKFTDDKNNTYSSQFNKF